MALIIRIAKQFPGRCWYNYDRAFRLQAAASNLLNWSQINSDLYHYHTSVSVQTSRPQISRTREPRGNQNASIACKSWNTGVVLVSIVDFATNVIGLGVMAHTAESSARNSRTNECVVLETNQAVGDTQAAISRDGVDSANKINIFSCLLVQNNFELPDISSVTPINVDNLSVQLCGHPDRHKVEYVLTGFREGFRRFDLDFILNQ